MMQNDKHPRQAVFLAICFVFLFAASGLAGGQTFTVVDNLNGLNGAQPLAGVIADNAGNLYVTTSAGGLGAGTVLELTPMVGGGWSETILYEFGSQNNDGSYPSGALVFDTAGNLYGTTQHGGAFNGGTVFQLSSGAGGSWTETILHSFGTGTDGLYPTSGLVIDPAGNLYGTTLKGGVNLTCSYSGTISSCGTAFELTPVTGGGWTYSVIHHFGARGDAYFPWSALTLDSAGNLFGGCVLGGPYGRGITYELLPAGGGIWTEKVIHAWGNGNDGSYPYGGVVFDALGNLYGTTSQSGVKGNMGAVFRLTPSGNTWQEQILYYFGVNIDGQFPESNLVFDAAGNLYGTTHNGGSLGSLGYGILYRLTPGSGSWTETVLYNFSGGSDGGIASGSLVMDNAGNIFGTTWYGGSAQSCVIGPIPGCGVVFQVSTTTGNGN